MTMNSIMIIILLMKMDIFDELIYIACKFLNNLNIISFHKLLLFIDKSLLFINKPFEFIPITECNNKFGNSLKSLHTLQRVVNSFILLFKILNLNHIISNYIEPISSFKTASYIEA